MLNGEFKVQEGFLIVVRDENGTVKRGIFVPRNANAQMNVDLPPDPEEAQRLIESITAETDHEATLITSTTYEFKKKQ